MILTRRPLYNDLCTPFSLLVSLLFVVAIEWQLAFTFSCNKYQRGSNHTRHYPSKLVFYIPDTIRACFLHTRHYPSLFSTYQTLSKLVFYIPDTIRACFLHTRHYCIKTNCVVIVSIKQQLFTHCIKISINTTKESNYEHQCQF